MKFGKKRVGKKMMRNPGLFPSSCHPFSCPTHRAETVPPDFPSTDSKHFFANHFFALCFPQNPGDDTSRAGTDTAHSRFAVYQRLVVSTRVCCV